MAKEKISELDAAAALDGTEEIPVVQDGATVRTTTDAAGNVPRTSYTTAQRDALTPTNGQIIYNTDDDEFQGYQNGAWVTFDTTPV